MPVICLGGPTGSGKTAIAIDIAKRINGEIINADSRQIYKDFPIITAQPTHEEQNIVPHHLYGFLESNKNLSAGVWAKLAYEKSREIVEKGKRAIIVGGTGFYIRALLEGLAQIPQIPEEIRRYWNLKISSDGVINLYESLKKIDTDYSKKIDPHDKQRIQRALEVYSYTGKSLSWWHNQNVIPLCKGPLFVIDTSLSYLTPILNSRIDKMISSGAIVEAENAYKKNNVSKCAWSGIGCHELFLWLDKKIEWDECLTRWRKQTRAYAKRQITWFKGRINAIHLNGQTAIETILQSI